MIRRTLSLMYKLIPIILILSVLVVLCKTNNYEGYNPNALISYRRPQYHAHINEFGKAIWVDTIRPDQRGDYSCRLMEKCPTGMNKNIMCWSCLSLQFDPQFKDQWNTGAIYFI